MLLPLTGNRTLDLAKPRIMGILNVTPDSFSDGGAHEAVAPAVAHARAMLAEGADVIDVGGESTRPGSQRVPADEQKRRVVEVVRRVRETIDATPPRETGGFSGTISVDTTLAAVAEAALDAGAEIINDVSAGRDDAGMFALAAARRVPIVLMHMQGTPESMQANPTYGDVVAEVEAFLLERATAAMKVGVARERIVLDPGIGFGKTKLHNLALLAALPRFVATGYPILLGASRKRFMGSICSNPDGSTPTPGDLVGATSATTALGAAAGVQIFRVHDVRPNRQAAHVAHAIARSG